MPSTVTTILDGLSTSVAVKAPCRTVATSNITLAGLQTISGYTTVEGDRVLVVGQTNSVHNGIYVASTGNWTRAKDADGARDLVQGSIVLVRNVGTDGAIWELTTSNPIVIGTSALTFSLRDDPANTYAQTESEIAAGVVPFNYAYEPGNVKRYGALGDGSGDTIPAEVAAAINWPTFITGANYNVRPGHNYGDATYLANNKPFTTSDTWDFVAGQLAIWASYNDGVGGGQQVYWPQGEYVINRSLRYTVHCYGDFVGDHRLLSKIKMKHRGDFPSIDSLSGKPLLYFFRMGLSGIWVHDIGFATVFESSFNGDANTLPGALTNATCCIAAQNTDTLTVSDCFLSGLGELGMNFHSASSVIVRDVITEYYSIHYMMHNTCNLSMSRCTVFNTFRNTNVSIRTSGIWMAGSVCHAYVDDSWFWEPWYGGIRSTDPTNTVRVHDCRFHCQVTSETDGTGWNIYLGDSAGPGVRTFDIQGCLFLFGNHEYAPVVLNSAAPSVFSGNYLSSVAESGSLTAVTWGAMFLAGTGHIVSNNVFEMDQVGSPQNGGNIVYSANSAPYSSGTSRVVFSNNSIRNQGTAKIALDGIVSTNAGTSTGGTVALTSGITSGTFYSLIAANVLERGTYLVELYWNAPSAPYNVSCSGICRVEFFNSATRGPQVALTQIDTENAPETLELRPCVTTNQNNGFDWSPSFTYAGLDSTLSWKLVRLA